MKKWTSFSLLKNLGDMEVLETLKNKHYDILEPNHKKPGCPRLQNNTFQKVEETMNTMPSTKFLK